MGSETRFASEWQTYNKILPEYEIQFKNWVRPFNPDDFKRKIVLDAGCGNGRNSYWPLKYGARIVYAFDHNPETVKVAANNLKNFKNARVFYGSIYDIPLSEKVDIAISIGVIHHLKNPKAATLQLIKATKPGGRVLIWVYGIEGNEQVVFIINLLRKITINWPPTLVRKFAFFPAILVYIQTRLPSKHLYINQLKSLSFTNIHSIVFDQLLPEIARYYTRRQAEDLLRAKDIKNIQATHVNGNSWAVVGTKI